MSRYLILSNFKEKLIEIDIARFFGAYLPFLGHPYYLENADEGITGSDLISEDANAIPVYMQAKVSHGLKTISEIAASTRKNRSYLEDIRIYRNDLELDYNEKYFLFFPLRKKAPTAIDFQHNILMQYANSSFSHAFYVSPLSITKIEYERILFDQANFDQRNPFYFHQYDIKYKNWTSTFGFIPYLRNHISIIPHERIDTHEHYYAFSKDSIDVTWHSPQFINSKPSRLADTLISIFNRYYQTEEKTSLKSLSQKLLEMPIMQNAKISDFSPKAIIDLHGKLLEDQYQIKQVIFVIDKDNKRFY